MFKVVLYLTIILCTTALGNQVCSKYNKRKNYILEFLKFNNYLKRNLYFNRRTICEVIDNFDCKEEQFKYTLDSVKLRFCNFTDEEVYIPNWIEDKDFYLLYFKNIGNNCSVCELDYINETEEIANEKLSKIKDNCSKFSKLGQKIGLAFGIMVVILII